MIQNQGDDGDHHFDIKPWAKIARTHMHTPTQSMARVHDTHTLTYSLCLSLPHTKAPTWLPRPDSVLQS